MTEQLSYSDESLREILLSVRTIAVVGASAKEIRPSYGVTKFLIAKGFTVFPVNPGLAGHSLLGRLCYGDLAGIPEPVDMIDVFRSSDALPGIVEEAFALDPRPRVIWTQLGVRHDEAARRAEAEGLRVVMDRCPKIEYPRLVESAERRS